MGAIKTVAIKLGYDAIVIVPVSKAGPLMAILADAKICGGEWVGSTSKRESGSVMVERGRKIEMEMNDFEILTREQYEAVCEETQKQREADDEAKKLAELNAEAAPN